MAKRTFLNDLKQKLRLVVYSKSREHAAEYSMSKYAVVHEENFKV